MAKERIEKLKEKLLSERNVTLDKEWLKDAYPTHFGVWTLADQNFGEVMTIKWENSKGVSVWDDENILGCNVVIVMPIKTCHFE